MSHIICAIDPSDEISEQYWNESWMSEILGNGYPRTYTWFIYFLENSRPFQRPNQGAFQVLGLSLCMYLRLNRNVMSRICEKWCLECFDFCCQFKAIQSEYQTNIKHKERRYKKDNAILDCFDLLECRFQFLSKFYEIFSKFRVREHLDFLGWTC